MKYFLDSAKIDEIAYADENWGIDGVTTNPRHIMESGRGLFVVLRELAGRFDGRTFSISVEVNPHLATAGEMVAEAKKIRTLSENFCLKIPCTEQGLVAAKQLNEAGVPTNLTLIFSASQALQAARIGCRYCSPFIGWREASGDDGLGLVDNITRIYANYGFTTEIIVAAVRNGAQIVEAAKRGAHVVTAGFAVYKDSFHHPYTDHGMKIFAKAWDETDTKPPQGM